MSTVSSSVTAKFTRKAWYDTDLKPTDQWLQRQKEVQENIRFFLTPLNISIVLIIVTILYLRSRSSSGAVQLDPTRPITYRTFTPRSLLRYNGTKNELNPNASVYLAVRGKVYDVSPGRNFYGPGGPYENFAGRDATRGLACQSFDEEMLTEDLDGPLDPCDDLDAAALENLKGWEERFDEKYLIVGKLVAYNQKGSEF